MYSLPKDGELREVLLSDRAFFEKAFSSVPEPLADTTFTMRFIWAGPLKHTWRERSRSNLEDRTVGVRFDAPGSWRRVIAVAVAILGALATFMVVWRRRWRRKRRAIEGRTDM